MAASGDFGGFDDDFPLDQFADLSTFSSPVVVASFSSPSPSSPEKKSPKPSKTTTTTTTTTVTNATTTSLPVVIVEKDQPSPLIQQLASVLVARLYDLALQLRDDADQRLVRNSLHARHDLPAFVSTVVKNVESTALQFLQKFDDEKKKDLAVLWSHYSLYKRTKPKDNMSKRQFLLLINHWLQALAVAETAAVNRSYETIEEKDSTASSGEGRGSKGFFGFGGKPKDKPSVVPLRLNKEVLQEFHQWVLFGAATMLGHVDLVVDAVWERLYMHDAATGLNPRGDPSAPEGCQSKFALNFIPSLHDLKFRYGAQVERRSIPALESCYEKMLQEKLAADRQRAYTKHLESTGLI